MLDLSQAGEPVKECSLMRMITVPMRGDERDFAEHPLLPGEKEAAQKAAAGTGGPRSVWPTRCIDPNTGKPIKCWYCGLPIHGMPIGRPTKYDKSRKLFTVEGRFNSWSCVLAQILDSKINKIDKDSQINWLTIMRTKSFLRERARLQKGGTRTEVTAQDAADPSRMIELLPLMRAPPPQVMKPYGGFLTKQEYMESLDTAYIDVLNPDFDITMSDIYVRVLDLQDMCLSMVNMALTKAMEENDAATIEQLVQVMQRAKQVEASKQQQQQQQVDDSVDNPTDKLADSLASIMVPSSDGTMMNASSETAASAQQQQDVTQQMQQAAQQATRTLMASHGTDFMDTGRDDDGNIKPQPRKKSLADRRRNKAKP